MVDIIDQIGKIAIDITKLPETMGLVLTNPFLFLLLVSVVIDIITGIGATLINKKGLDSSIAFEGWVKHSEIIIVSLITEIVANMFGIGFIGDIITLCGTTVYIESIPGNIAAMKFKLPNWAIKLFKAEIQRKAEKYNIHLEDILNDLEKRAQK